MNSQSFFTLVEIPKNVAPAGYAAKPYPVDSFLTQFNKTRPPVESFKDQTKKIISWLKSISRAERQDKFTFQCKDFTTLARAMHEKRRRRSERKFWITEEPQSQLLLIYGKQNQTRVEDLPLDRAEKEFIDNVLIVSKQELFDSITLNERILDNVEGLFVMMELIEDGVNHDLTIEQWKTLEASNSKELYYYKKGETQHYKNTLGQWLVQVFKKKIWSEYYYNLQEKVYTPKPRERKKYNKQWKELNHKQKAELLGSFNYDTICNIIQKDQHCSRIRMQMLPCFDVPAHADVLEIVEWILGQSDLQIYEFLTTCTLQESCNPVNMARWPLMKHIKAQRQKYVNHVNNNNSKSVISVQPQQVLKIVQVSIPVASSTPVSKNSKKNRNKKPSKEPNNLSQINHQIIAQPSNADALKPKVAPALKTQTVAQNPKLQNEIKIKSPSLSIVAKQQKAESDVDELEEVEMSTANQSIATTKKNRKRRNRKKNRADIIEPSPSVQHPKNAKKIQHTEYEITKKYETQSENHQVSEHCKDIIIENGDRCTSISFTSNDTSQSTKYQELGLEAADEELSLTNNPDMLESISTIVLNKIINRVADSIYLHSNEYFKARFVTFNRIQSVLNTMGISLRLFGSCDVGLALANSDIDLAVAPSILNYFYGSPISQRQKTCKSLEIIKSLLVNHSWAKNINLIKTASVPVLKLEVDPYMPYPYTANSPLLNFVEGDFIPQVQETIKIDMTIESFQSATGQEINHLGILVTNHMKEWLSTYPNLMKVSLVLKYILKIKDLNIIYTGGLSSYALLIILVAYYQHKKIYQQKVDAGTVLYGFLHFLLEEFDHSKYGIDIRPVNKQRERKPQEAPYPFFDISEVTTGKIQVKDFTHGKIFTANSHQYDRILQELRNIYQSKKKLSDLIYNKLQARNPQEKVRQIVTAESQTLMERCWKEYLVDLKLI